MANLTTVKSIAAANYGRTWSIEQLAGLVSTGKLTKEDFKEITTFDYSLYIPSGTELADYKAAKIVFSKEELEAFLIANPITWKDGKRYSVTSEKQSLLTSALARHQIAAAAGQTLVLKWNATGEECVEWTYENLAALALAIADYVEPLVAQQQRYEVQINEMTEIQRVVDLEIVYTIPTSQSAQ